MQGKALLEPNAETRVYVGIDVCKDWLDVYVHPVGHKRHLANTPVGVAALKRDLTGLSVALITMEATGKYHRQAHKLLDAAGLAVTVVNPLRSRLFAEVIGQYRRPLYLFGAGHVGQAGRVQNYCQNGDPVSAEKCHRTVSRTCASSTAHPRAAMSCATSCATY